MKSSRTSSVTFDDIKAMLKAHVEVLLHHTSYIRDIENNKISDEDLANYLRELFDFSVPDTQIFRLIGVPGLKRAIDIKLRTFLHFLKIARHPNEELAMSALYIAMQCEIFYAGVDLKLSRGKSKDFTEKFQTALNEHGFLKKLHTSLHALLPSDFPILTNYVSYIIRCDKETNWEENPQYIYSWEHVKNTIDTFTSKFINMKTGEWTNGNPFKVKLDVSVVKLPGWQTLHDQALAAQGLKFYDNTEIPLRIIDLRHLAERLDAQIAMNTKMNDVNVKTPDLVAWVYNLVFQNVEFYFEIRNRLNDSLNFLRSMNMLPSLLLELEKSISQTIKLGRVEYRRMCKSVSFVEEEFKVINDNPAKLDLENELDKCRCTMEQLANNERLELDAAMIKAMAKDFDRQMSIVNKLLTAAKKFQPPKMTEQELVVGNQKDEKRELALLEGERKRQAYREQVMQQRQAREALKLAQKTEKPIILPSAPITFFENETVKHRLLKMPSTYFDLMLSILRNERNIHYQQVCLLITNHLGGSITEHGSSHKSFRIEKLYVEVTCHEMLTTGGICGPHSGAHQSGVMSSFNVELVAKAFVAAGYTEAVLLEIEAERIMAKLTR